jgi:hypothetical protein
MVIYENFPKEVSIQIYRWVLGVTNKGSVTPIAKKFDKKTECAWREITNTLRGNPYYLRLWKGIATATIKKGIFKSCVWCASSNTTFKKCERCTYDVSIPKVARVFNLNYKELIFILSNLNRSDFVKFKNRMLKVEILIPFALENEYHSDIFKSLNADLQQSGNLNSRIEWGKYKQKEGFHRNDILSDCNFKIMTLIRRYDYLPFEKLIKICGTSLFKNSVNIYREYKIKKLKFVDNVIRLKSVKGGVEKKSIFDVIPDSNTKDVIDEVHKKTVLTYLQEGLDDELKKAVSVMLGKEDEDFINFLKRKEELKTKNGWECFYNKIQPSELLRLVNEYCGCHVDKKLLKHVRHSHKLELRKSNNVNVKGENKMSKFVINIPKKKCIACANFIPYLNKKKFTPKDCTPAYPGCPVHSFEVVHAFPKKQAAIQLRIFIDNGEDDKVKEFIDSCPNASEIMQVALTLTLEEIEEAQLQMIESQEEERIDISDMKLADMKDFMLENEIVIKGIKGMDENQLRNALQAYIDSMYEKEEEDNDDDDDENVRIVGKISESRSTDEGDNDNDNDDESDT